MEGFAHIGSTYSLREPNKDRSLIWAVIRNDSNNKTSTITVVEDCLEHGRTEIVDAKKLNELQPLGMIIKPAGEVVIEDGIEYIKRDLEHTKEKCPSKSLRPKNKYNHNVKMN